MSRKDLQKISPAWVLFLLAPVCGEFISGHMDPATFFNPLTWLMMAMPYGAGALLIRELIVRWGKGRFSLLLLALAYGIYEEAIVVRSTFDPGWLELESLSTAHVWGINWTFSFMLLQFHILISIFAPISITELLFPQRREEPWTSTPVLVLCGLILAAWLPWGLWATHYQPPLAYTILSWVLLVGLVLAARFLPGQPFSPPEKNPGKPIKYFILGFLNILIMFILVGVVADNSSLPIWLPVLLMAINLLVSFWLLMDWSGRGTAWQDRHRLAWVAGLLCAFIPFTFLGGLEEPDSFTWVNALITLGLFIWLFRRLKTRAAVTTVQDTPENPDS